jgi:hypothetical protein
MDLNRGTDDLVGQPICSFLRVYLKLLCALRVFVVHYTLSMIVAVAWP